jgi:hypothetical protein
MAGEQMTDREAALVARIKELEGASAKGAATTAEGGALESVWRRVADIVPSSLVAAGLAVLVAHYGFGYYLQSQVTAAETQLKQAKAKLETAKANAANTPEAQGISLRLATLKAEIDNKRAEAAAAKANATALNAQVNGESAALAASKANLDNLQQQARNIKIKADAAGATLGLSTLEERAVRAKLKSQQIDEFSARGLAAFNQVFDVHQALSQRPKLALVNAECSDNPMAEEIGCPSQFWQRKPKQQNSVQVATAPTDDTSEDWKARGTCAGQLAGFNRYSDFGSFALTKRARNGQSGCAWGAGAGKSRERVRREALELCARQGADCKIVSEK